MKIWKGRRFENTLKSDADLSLIIYKLIFCGSNFKMKNHPRFHMARQEIYSMLDSILSGKKLITNIDS
jgi:hypothetical protein